MNIIAENQAIRVVDKYGCDLDVRTRDTDVTEVARIFERQDKLGGKTGSNKAFLSSWIYSIATSIATTCSHVPYGFYKSLRGRSKRFSSQNWLPIEIDELESLMENPNPYQRFKQFAEQLFLVLSITGNYWILLDEPNSLGIPRAMLGFGPDRISPLRHNSSDPPAAWRLRMYGGQEDKIIPLESMIHFKLPNLFDQWMGMPPCIAMDVQLDADRARVAYDKFFFRNNATPDAVLTYKNGPLTKATRDMIYDSWQDAYGGAENHGGLAVIGGDFEIKQLGVAHSASEYIANRKFTRAEAASIYHYPVQLLNDVEGGGIGRDQLTTARQIKFENVIFPYCDRFSEGIMHGLLRKLDKYKKIGYFPDYDGLPVMVDFMAAKSETLKKMVESGIPLNNAVAKLDLGIDDVDGGEVGYINKNFIPLTVASEVTKEDLAPPTPQLPAPDPNRPTKDPAVKVDKKAKKNIYHSYLSTGIKRLLIDIRANQRKGVEFDSTAGIAKLRSRLLSTIVFYMQNEINPIEVDVTKKLLKKLSYTNTIEIENLELRSFIEGHEEMLIDFIERINSHIGSDLNYIFNDASKIADSIALKIMLNCRNFIYMQKGYRDIVRDSKCFNIHALEELVSPNRLCYCAIGGKNA